MLPNTSTSLDPKVAALASRFQEPGTQLLLAKTIATPVRVYKVLCDIVEARSLAMLEEFVLRAAIDIHPPLHWQQLAGVLKIDERFVADTRQQLQRKGALQDTDWLQITEQGNRFYADGQISSKPTSVTWYLMEVATIRCTVALKNRPSIINATQTQVVSTDVVLNTEGLQVEELIALTNDAGFNYHNGEQQITKCHSIELIESGFLEWGICAIYDWLTRQTDLYIVQQPSQHKFKAPELQMFLQALENSQEFQRILSDVMPPITETTNVSPEWIDITSKINSLYKGELESARNHTDSLLNEADLTRVDCQTTPDVLQHIQGKTTEALVLIPDTQLLSDQDLFYSWMQSLTERSIITLLVLPQNMEIDAQYVQQLEALRLSEVIPAVSVLQVDEALPFLALVDNAYVFLKIQTAVNDHTIRSYPNALLVTDELNSVQSLRHALMKLLNEGQELSFWQWILFSATFSELRDEYSLETDVSVSAEELVLLSEQLPNLIRTTALEPIVGVLLSTKGLPLDKTALEEIIENIAYLLSMLSTVDQDRYHRIFSRYSPMLERMEIHQSDFRDEAPIQ